MLSGKEDIHEGLWTPPPTLEYPIEHEKKIHQVYENETLRVKKKCNSALSDMCVVKYLVPI